MTVLGALSYNVHSCVGRDGRCVPERVLEVLRRQTSAIIGLQEVDARPGRNHRLDQFEYFAEQSGMTCIAGPSIVEREGRYGNVLLTSLPIESHRLVKLPTRAREPRGAIVALLGVGAERLQVVATHLGLRGAERAEQVSRLLGETAAHEGPTLFLGDFNVWHRRSGVLTRLGAPSARRLVPRTFPAFRPLFPLDRIWSAPVGLVASVHAIRDDLTLAASDHLPVRAEISLRRGRSAAA